MQDGGATRAVFGAHLEHYIDERARLEVFAVEPLVEDVEDGQQSLLRVRATADGTCFDEVLGPALLAELQEREHELVLGGEVTIERRGRDTSALDHLVDAHCADS